MADNEDILVFDDLRLKEKKLELGMKKYVLVEASAEAVVLYRNASMRGVRLTDEGKVAGMDGIAEAEPVLVAACLYEADEEHRLRLMKNGRPDPYYRVPLETIKGWRNEVVAALYEWVKETSRLEAARTKEALWKEFHKVQKQIRDLDQEEHRLKNLRNGTRAGSSSPSASDKILSS